MSPIRSTRSRTTAVLAVVVALLGPALASLAASTPDLDEVVETYLVQSASGEMGDVTRAIRSKGGGPKKTLDSMDLAVAELTPSEAAELAAHPDVIAVTADSHLELASATYDPKADVDSMYSIATVIGARDAWGRYTGRGVDVALIDSGVTPVPGLDGAGKIVSGPDLSFESQVASLRHLDSFGHGTHMAGIIAGRDNGTDMARAVAGDATSFLGVAPDARIVSLKVADAHGATDVSQVVAAIDWVVQHGRSNGLNVRVLNLSFATRPLQPYQLDPLAHAAEVAWRRGIVVVVSAGNAGSADGSLANPAYDPYLLAVGAVDANGTRDTVDDVVPAYSSRGDGVRNPDLVAPGAHVQSLRVPGSFIDDRFGAGPGSINERFLRGSGTSQAAAVVSGAVALLLEQRPTLTPDQVKALLMSTARYLPSADPQADGSGLVNIKKALQTARWETRQTWSRAAGTGLLDRARGGVALVHDGVALQGEIDIFGLRFDAPSHASHAEAGEAWDGGDWNGSTWAGTTWAGTTWAGTTWAGTTWAGTTWAGTTWAGTTWASGTWTGTTWAGTTWAGTTWAGSTWADDNWTGQTWATANWR